LTISRDDKRILKLTTLFQMTYPGAPSIYYGDEIGLRGGRDPDCRRAMPWHPAQWEADLLEFYKKVITIRKAHPALRRGSYVRLYASESLGVYAFLRQMDRQQIVVVLNNSESDYSVDVPVRGHLADGTTFRCLMSSEKCAVREDRLRGPALSPRSGAILLAQ
jgi:neopullulanase